MNVACPVDADGLTKGVLLMTYVYANAMRNPLTFLLVVHEVLTRTALVVKH